MTENSSEPTLDQLEMFRLHVCAGMNQSEVAEWFGMTQQAISKHVRFVREYLRYAKREEISTLRATLTEKWEHLYVQAVRAWNRSQKTEVVKTIQDSEKTGVTETVRETPQVGAPAFLKIAQDALKGIEGLWAGEMTAVDRRGDGRSAGKTQLQRIEMKLEELNRAKLKLLASQNGGGAGDRA